MLATVLLLLVRGKALSPRLMPDPLPGRGPRQDLVMNAPLDMTGKNLSDDSLTLLKDGHFSALITSDAPECLKEIALVQQRQSADALTGTVAISTSCSRAMVALADMMRDVTDINHRGQAIAAASEEMVASVREIATTSEAASQDASRALHAAGAGLEATSRAEASMNQIARSVDTAAAQVHELAEASKQIGGIVREIEAIAKQTNLLALNATIEAARAGEAGKGFAVVATEVKALATQTAAATVDISGRIETLQREMALIVSSMEASADAVTKGRAVIAEAGAGMQAINTEITGITGKMTDIAAILSQQSQASGEVAQGMQAIADMTGTTVMSIGNVAGIMHEADALIQARIEQIAAQDIPFKVIEVAKSDHVSFKKRLYEVMIGRLSIDIKTLADHKTCRLGTWYDSVADVQVRTQPAFTALAEPHARVHAHGRSMLEWRARGNQDRALAELHEVERASEDVLRHLDDLGRALRS
jgi:methyl-accepting chemotaxis protein